MGYSPRCGPPAYGENIRVEKNGWMWTAALTRPDGRFATDFWGDPFDFHSFSRDRAIRLARRHRDRANRRHDAHARSREVVR